MISSFEVQDLFPSPLILSITNLIDHFKNIILIQLTFRSQSQESLDFGVLVQTGWGNGRWSNFGLRWVGLFLVVIQRLNCSNLNRFRPEFFYPENDNLNCKMEILKFLGIQPKFGQFFIPNKNQKKLRRQDSD